MNDFEERPKRILIVDDDDTFRTALKYVLIKKGFEIVLANGGKEAAEIFRNSRVDAIISDINMPEGNGLDLLKFVKESSPIPFVLMTGLKTLDETHEAFILGADYFLAKPFEKKDLLYAVESCFSPKNLSAGSEPVLPKDGDYVSLDIDEFVCGKEMQFEIFIKLNAQKFVKIAHGGEDITIDQVRAYKSKGIMCLYMKKEDFQLYLKFTIMLSKKVSESDAISVEKKKHFLKHTSKLLWGNDFLANADSEAFKYAQTIVESTISVFAEEKELFDVLQIFQAENAEIYSHSLSVSMLSIMLAHDLDWKSSSTSFRLASAGIFHDIGLRELPQELTSKSRVQMTYKEKNLYESHAYRSVELLKNLKGLSSEVLSIIIQHHENELGHGYPNGLLRNKIHPLAKVLAVADEYCSSLPSTSPTIEEARATARKFSTLAAGMYDQNVLDALFRVLKMPEGMSKSVKDAYYVKKTAS